MGDHQQSALTEDELALVTVLLTGATDRTARGRLGWTERTYRRRLRALMDRLDATSRFQAGYLLALSGPIGQGQGVPRVAGAPRRPGSPG